MNVIDTDAYVKKLRQGHGEGRQDYLAMYSSWLGGVVTDPVLMQLPIDDHMVHRGDGVFEMLKCVSGGIYNMEAHFDRLESSMAGLGLRAPLKRSGMRQLIIEMLDYCGVEEAAIRIYISRGPGSFGVNPYDSPQAQCYIVVSRRSPSFMELHPQGARIGVSEVALKPPAFATVKTCNYLPNAMMKKEAVDRGLDFTVALDENGMLGEGATENVGIITSRGALLFPKTGRVLQGTTMMRLVHLAESLVVSGVLSKVGFADISVQDLRGSEGVVIVGTTTDVTHVRQFEDRDFGEPGMRYKQLSDLLFADIHQGSACRTLIGVSPGA